MMKLNTTNVTDWVGKSNADRLFTVSFSGLDTVTPSLTYDVQAVIGGFTGTGTTDGTTIVGGGQNGNFGAESLNPRIVNLTGVVADGFGGLEFTIARACGVAVLSSLTLTAIPEPSSYALIGGALALTSVMLRRRRA